MTTINDLSPEQMGDLIEQFSAIETNRLNTHELQTEHTAMLVEHYAKKSPNQLKDLIDADDPGLLDKLINIVIHLKEEEN